MTTKKQAQSLEQILAEISKRAESATEGPWHNLDTKGKPDKKVRCNTQAEINSPYDSEERANLKACRGEVANTLSWNTSKASEQHREAVRNAEFIAHARTDVPALIEALKLAIQQRDTAIACYYHEVHGVRNREYESELKQDIQAENAELAEILKGKV